MASSSGSTKVCFNSTCKEALEVPRQGWLCRTGDFADLCDRCSSAFKDGKFCDTYHLNASGWRSCESCGKKIHCGCIVSFHMFILLDAGGIECLNCAKSEYISTPNPTWPSGTHFLPGHAERIKDLSSKNWRSIAGSGPIPWRQAPSLFNASKSIDKPLTNDSTGVHNLFQSFFTNERATPLSSLPATFVGQDKKTEKGILCPQTSVWKLRNPNNNSNNNNPPGTSLEAQNAKPRGRHQLLPRYWPRLTDQELQQISGGSNAKITPLFEKVLSASDAGRIGRLVLPKKCAEAYLPPISQPEGYPLVVQDLKGKDWVLQFRFWPNNNSRMYVLEGVTPCIQSMQLQAGDTVTFSRLEPEGKLVMGFRKAPPASPTNIPTHEESSKGNIGNYTKNPDGAWSEADKIPIHSKRKKALNTMCSNSKHIKLNVTLEQVQGLLRPPLTNPPTIVLIEGIEFEDYQEEPIIGSPTEHLPHTLPMSSATGFCKKNELEKAETVKTKEGLDALASLAIQDHNHKPGCTCVVCIQAPSGTNQNSVTEILYADIIRYNNNQMGENEAKKEKSVKTQNIDLNIQPEREEEASPVSESMGIIRLVQESTHRYIRQQKLSANGVIDKN